MAAAHYEPVDDDGHLEGLRDEAKQHYRNTLGSRDRELGAIFKAVGPSSNGWKTVENLLTDARDDYRAKFAALNRPTDAKSVSKLVLLFVFLICVAGEATVNKYMFDMLMRTSNLYSYIYSMIITAVLLIVADVAGWQLRQVYGAFEQRVYVTKIVGFAFAFFFVLAVVTILTIERAHYSLSGFSVATGNSTGTAGDIFSQVTGHIANQIERLGFWGTILAALADREALMLAIINAAGIIFAFLIGFFTNDSDKIFQSTLDEYARAQRKFDRLASKYEGKIEQIDRKYAARLEAYASAYGARNAKVIESKRRRNIPLTDDDRLDINSLDIKLEQARTGIADRATRVSQETQETSSDPIRQNDSVQLVQPVIATRERR